MVVWTLPESAAQAISKRGRQVAFFCAWNVMDGLAISPAELLLLLVVGRTPGWLQQQTIVRVRVLFIILKLAGKKSNPVSIYNSLLAVRLE